MPRGARRATSFKTGRSETLRYYNLDRPHMSLSGDAPAQRAVEGPELGRVVALPRVGGLHHRYVRHSA